MADSHPIVELVEASEAFERCSDCGRYLASTSNHRYRPTGRDRCSPNRAERARRARADTRRDDTPVGVLGRTATTTYAYHDLVNGKPRCGCHRSAPGSEIEVVALSSAKARGRSPCRNCQRLR